MKFAFVNDNLVKKVQDVDSEDLAFAQLPHYQQVINIEELTPQPCPGWAWDGHVLYKPRVDLTPRQLRLALLSSGVNLTDISDAIDAMPEPTKSYASISWDYATIFERRDPLISAVAGILELSEAEIDQIWDLGSSL